MTVLLTLIVILQAVIVAWMVFITLLTFSHDTDLRNVQADKITEYIGKVKEYAGRIEGIVGEYQKVKKSAEEARDQAKNIQHDIQLQQARSAMNPVSQPVFTYKEPEEDPEEPRS